MLPKNGRNGMTMPGANAAVIDAVSIGMILGPAVRSHASGTKPLHPL